MIEADQFLFYLINHSLSNSLFDSVVPWLRNDKFWIPLYVFLISFILFNFGKKAYWLIIFVIITASAADIISSRVVKPLVKRTRPCRTEMSFEPRVLVNCGSGYSFTSSHATNHFAVAAFLSMALGRYIRRLSFWLYFWAASVAFAQVYVGVHFPLDVISGAILGFLIAALLFRLYYRYYGKEFYGLLTEVGEE